MTQSHVLLLLNFSFGNYTYVLLQVYDVFAIFS